MARRVELLSTISGVGGGGSGSAGGRVLCRGCDGGGGGVSEPDMVISMGNRRWMGVWRCEGFSESLPQSEVVPAIRGSFRTKTPLFSFLFGAEKYKDTQKEPL